jgi:hypothetical protein
MKDIPNIGFSDHANYAMALFRGFPFSGFPILNNYSCGKWMNIAYFIEINKFNNKYVYVYNNNNNK